MGDWTDQFERETRRIVVSIRVPIRRVKNYLASLWGRLRWRKRGEK